MSKNLTQIHDLNIEKDNDFYGIVLSKELIATMSIFTENPKLAHLISFAVRPTLQKQCLAQNFYVLQ